MKEFVHVEFLFEVTEYSIEFEKLHNLGEDFHLITTSREVEVDEDDTVTQYVRVQGKINTQAASMIKLQNPVLAGKMRISYIPDELKDKYRR